MKTIGIIGALDEEIMLLKNNAEIVNAKNIVSTDFFMGKMHGKSVVIARCGVGKVNAAICTQVLVDIYGVDYVVNIGVAGGLHPDLKVCDTVISSDLLHHDFDATGFGYELGHIPRNSESIFEADETLIQLALEGAQSIEGNNTHIGRIVTGDQFICTSADKERILSNFKPHCVEMEGAGIAQACYLNKIPFVVIRSMSDVSDEDAMGSFEENVQRAAKNASIIVEHIVKEL